MSRLTDLGGLLHEEHFRILVWVTGLKTRASTERKSSAFDPEMPRERRALQEVIRAVDDVLVHHAFEEENIFPRILGRNDADSAACLAEEHAFIEPIARDLRRAADGLLQSGDDASLRHRLYRGAHDLFSAMLGHLVLEEMVVVQRLATLLDGDVDRRLAAQHGALRLSFAAVN